MEIFINDEEIEINYEKGMDFSFLEGLNRYIIKMKKEILSFFGLDSCEKIKINIFLNREVYLNFVSKHINVSSYNTGCCIEGEIYYFCDKSMLREIYKRGFLMACIVHELVHLIYYKKVNKNKCNWLEEGLAQYLSGQKSFIQNDEQKYKMWLKNNIFLKEIPKMEYLLSHGNRYGQFCDMETNRYNGYDFSYALVKYINDEYEIEKKNKIIMNPDFAIEIQDEIQKDFVSKYKDSMQ